MAERLLERDLSAASFGADVASPPPARARTVVVGGGIVGASVAYHLALTGERDVLLLERSSVASGSSWHAAGLIVRARATPALTVLAAYGVDLYAGLERETGVDVGFAQPGSLTLARTPGRLEELRYGAAVARLCGVPAAIVDAAAVPGIWPLATAAGLVGGLHQPLDGYVNPGLAALALVKGAHARGAILREGVAVTGIAAVGGRVASVRTDAGDVECERVVLATGLWTRDLAARCGASVPLYPAEHVHVRTAPIAGAASSLPVLRDLDGRFYVRHERGALLVGAFEPDGKPRPAGDFGRDFAFGTLPADREHFEGVRQRAIERIPALAETDFERFLCAPESFTPDGAFCLGETAEVEGLWVAAGFNSQGIIFAPGAGRALAEWLQAGAPTFDVTAVDVRRFARQQSSQRYLRERTTEALGRLYAMHWPGLEPTTARGLRRTPLHGALAAVGACFGEANGWERATWFAPPGVAARAEYSYGRPGWFEYEAAEHRAAREAVALFDLSSFCKVEVAGPDALDVLQATCTADVDVPAGGVVYTLWLNLAGGIELDGTVVRLGPERFWAITPTTSQAKTLSILRRAAVGRAAAVVDVSSGYATLAVMGPSSRRLLAALTPDDLDDEAFGYRTARELEIGRGFALAVRISYVGELGFELYPAADQALDLYEHVVAAGVEHGLRHAGYHALDSLRSEKGFRHLGHDIGPTDDPFDAGLGFAVCLSKPSFTGHEIVRTRRGEGPTTRVLYVRLDDPEPLLRHDESIIGRGEIVGRVTSGAYGHTIGAACGLAVVRADVKPGACAVDVAGRTVPATLAERPFYDPDGSRMRGGLRDPGRRPIE